MAVMQRLGMTRSPAEDFDHPRLPPGHPTPARSLSVAAAVRGMKATDTLLRLVAAV
jgi:hypothetical protein